MKNQDLQDSGRRPIWNLGGIWAVKIFYVNLYSGVGAGDISAQVGTGEHIYGVAWMPAKKFRCVMNFKLKIY